MKLVDFKEECLTNFSETKSHHTVQAYVGAFNRAIEFLGIEYDLGRLDYNTVEAMKTSWSQRFASKRTINKYLSTMNSIYKLYMRKYGQGINTYDDPFDGVMYNRRSIPKTKNHYFLTDSEFEQLYVTALEHNYYELCDLLKIYRYMGLRKNEPMDLTPESIKTDKSLLLVYSQKTNTYRTIPLFDEVKNILEGRVVGAPTRNGKLFSYSSATLHRHFKEVLKASGINQNITLHSLRKTFGSSLVNHVPLKLISKWLGHSSVKITEQWYIILLDNNYEQWVGAHKTGESNGNSIS